MLTHCLDLERGDAVTSQVDDEVTSQAGDGEWRELGV